MSTSAQVEKLVAPLLWKRRDLVFARRKIFFRPLRHILSAVNLGGSNDPAIVAVGTVVVPIFQRDHIHASWGWPVSRPDGWVYRLDQPDAQELLLHALEFQVLPRLSTIRDIPEFEQYVAAHGNGHRYDNPRRLITAAARGDLELALHLSRDLRAKGHLDGPGGDAESTRSIARRRTLCDLIEADDRAGIIALLHQWEAATAADWGLAHFWEPSPFPIEQM